MKNESGIKPVGHRVLILPEQVEEKTKGGLYIPQDLRNREEMAQAEAILVEVGNTAWLDQPRPEGMSFEDMNWPKVGSKIIFAKFQGTVLEGKDGKQYRLISDLDVVGEKNE